MFVADVPPSSRPSLSPEAADVAAAAAADGGTADDAADAYAAKYDDADADNAYANHDGLSEILSPSEQLDDGHGFDCPCDECKEAYGAGYVRVGDLPKEDA